MNEGFRPGSGTHCQTGAVRWALEVRSTGAAAYLRLVASLAPKELHLMRENPLDQFSDEEIAALLAAASRLAEAEAGGRAEKANGKGKPPRIH